MNILVINAGSSSVKFTFFRMGDNTVMAKGIVERIGINGTQLYYRNFKGDKIDKKVQVKDTKKAVDIITSFLTHEQYGVIKNINEITGIGHRVVHGGEEISKPVLINDRVKNIIKQCYELAPLHNPPNMNGIEACEKNFPGVPQVAIFDTAFHTSIPEYAYIYALPYNLYKDYKIRRYGFHGISHKYVSRKAASILNRPLEELRIITCHLGNGCSITAIKGGKSIDTSMGMTPLEGLIMGTRCGDLDPAIVFILMEHMKLDYMKINELLNQKSGLLGLAGIGSSDLRDIISARKDGNKQADNAIKAFCYRIKKYIGAYVAAMGGVDTIVFTGGIGENSALIRKLICAGLEQINGFGIILDEEKNAAVNRKLCEIQSDQSNVKILIISTDEEQEIAYQTIQVLRAPQQS